MYHNLQGVSRMKLRERFARFMYGRYGFGYGAADKLNFFLIILYLVLMVIGRIVPNSVASLVISVIGALVCVYLIFRMFSKNVYKRSAENQKFIMVWGRIKGFFTFNFRRIKEFRTNRYRRCPSCRAQLRLPKKKGKHAVVCPACKNRFEVNIIF